NTLVPFTGRGIRIWGARTLSSDPAFVQINVRRLFILVRKSVEKYAQWVVFEPNEPSLWKKMVRSIDVFLGDLWKEGALVGAAQDEAYYVKCDEETNPPEARDAGELICEIGISPVKPAEFIVIRIHQWTRERGLRAAGRRRQRDRAQADRSHQGLQHRPHQGLRVGSRALQVARRGRILRDQEDHAAQRVDHRAGAGREDGGGALELPEGVAGALGDDGVRRQHRPGDVRDAGARRRESDQGVAAARLGSLGSSKPQRRSGRRRWRTERARKLDAAERTVAGADPLAGDGSLPGGARAPRRRGVRRA